MRSRKNKIIIAVIATIIFVGGLTVWSLTNQYPVVNCKPFNKEHLIWFPYQQNDTLVFTSRGTEKKFIVNNFEVDSTMTYVANTKEGQCEEGVRMSLESATDTIEIEFTNFENTNCAYSPELIINSHVFYTDSIKVKSGQKSDSMLVANNYLVVRTQGLVRFVSNDSVWVLKN